MAPSGSAQQANVTELQGKWSEFVTRLNPGAEDVNALVQAVLREAYMENTKDLCFYAQKVKHFNQ